MAPAKSDRLLACHRWRTSGAGATSLPGSAVPRQHTTGGKPRLGRISKMGQRDLRRLLIIGAMAVGALGGAAGRDQGPVAGPDAGAQAEEAGRGGAGQPDRAHRLGTDDEQRGLPASRRRLSRRRGAGSRRGCGQDGGQGKGKWSTRRDRENQPWPACAQARKSDLDPIRVSPYRPAADNPPHSRGRTHDST